MPAKEGGELIDAPERELATHGRWALWIGAAGGVVSLPALLAAGLIVYTLAQVRAEDVAEAFSLLPTCVLPSLVLTAMSGAALAVAVTGRRAQRTGRPDLALKAQQVFWIVAALGSCSVMAGLVVLAVLEGTLVVQGEQWRP